MATPEFNKLPLLIQNYLTTNKNNKNPNGFNSTTINFISPFDIPEYIKTQIIHIDGSSDNCNYHILANSVGIKLDQLKNLIFLDDEIKKNYIVIYLIAYFYRNFNAGNNIKNADFRSSYSNNMEFNKYNTIFNDYDKLPEPIKKYLTTNIKTTTDPNTGFNIFNNIENIQNYIKPVNITDFNLIINKIKMLTPALKFNPQTMYKVFFNNNQNICLFEVVRKITDDHKFVISALNILTSNNLDLDNIQFVYSYAQDIHIDMLFYKKSTNLVPDDFITLLNTGGIINIKLDSTLNPISESPIQPNVSFEKLSIDKQKIVIKNLIKELNNDDVDNVLLDNIVKPSLTINEIINDYLDNYNKLFKDLDLQEKKLEIKKEMKKNKIFIDDILLDKIIKEKDTKEDIMNEINKMNRSLFPTIISKLIISVLIISLTGLLISGYNIDYKTIKKYIMITFIILIFEYYRGNNLFGGSLESSNFKGGSLNASHLPDGIQSLKNITDINKFYDVYKKNYLQKVNIKNINVSSYIQNISNYFNSNQSSENQIIITALSYFNLSDISKEVELQILNLNKEDAKTKSNTNFQDEMRFQEEDINIDEKEIYKKYKEITASLAGNLSKKSKELLLKKIKDLEILKKKINNQYNEIIEYTKLLSGVNNNNIMNLDNTLSEQTIHDYVTNYKKLIKKENKNTHNFKLILQTL